MTEAKVLPFQVELSKKESDLVYYYAFLETFKDKVEVKYQYFEDDSVHSCRADVNGIELTLIVTPADTTLIFGENLYFRVASGELAPETFVEIVDTIRELALKSRS